MILGLKVKMCKEISIRMRRWRIFNWLYKSQHVLEAMENIKLGLKVYMCKEISIRMRRWRI